jgi:DNA polymerase IIIc chi subunit
MPDIRFVGLTQATQEAQILRLCLRLEALTEEGKKVVVFASDDKASRWFEERLWTYEDSSFLPHARVAEKIPSPLNRVVIVDREAGHYRGDVLVNLSPEPLAPIQLDSSELVFEIFRQDTELGQEHGRTKWSAYKDAGRTATKEQL